MNRGDIVATPKRRNETVGCPFCGEVGIKDAAYLCGFSGQWCQPDGSLGSLTSNDSFTKVFSVCTRVGKAVAAEQSPRLCNCDMRTLLISGCQCGGK
jgi:hypothetical protein